MSNCRYQIKIQRHSSHGQIFKLLQQAPAASKILELGVASGYMGKYLSRYNFEISGIEKDRELAEQARPYYHKIFVLDLDREEMPALEHFDYIILADILEHLYDPFKLLRRMRSLLKENGQMFISVPNVANWVIRLSLALGKFDYADKGILDKGHIRFFTLKTAQKLIHDAEFNINNCYVTSLPFELLFKPDWFAKCLDRVYYLFAKAFPCFFAYQFVFTVSKTKKALSYEQL